MTRSIGWAKQVAGFYALIVRLPYLAQERLRFPLSEKVKEHSV